MKILGVLLVATLATAHKYLNMASKEIDSSEHGVTKGKRSTTCKCGWANRATSRLIGGTETEINQYPWAVALSYDGQVLCGGVIITEYHVLTAAHCTTKFSNDKMAVIVGAHSIAPGKAAASHKSIKVKFINENEYYESRMMSNDISVLELKEKIEFSDQVGPVCMPASINEYSLVDKYVKAVGWGRTVNNGPLSTELRDANLRVIPHSICTESFFGNDPRLKKEFGVHKATQICTFSKGRDICQGDSGGPVVYVDPETNRYTLVGLPSYVGLKCGSNSPAVSTKVEAFVEWVKEEIAQGTQPDSKICVKS